MSYPIQEDKAVYGRPQMKTMTETHIFSKPQNNSPPQTNTNAHAHTKGRTLLGMV